jgi:hypothetical protein
MADAQIQQNTKVSSVITPLDQHGSNVLLGNILMVPINQSMLYIRPLYVTSTGNPLPQLKYVIAVYGSHVAIETSLQASLNSVLSAAVELPSNNSGGGGSTNDSGNTGNAAAASALLDQAQSSYATAQAALKNGDLAGYQTAIQTMYQDLLAAQVLLNGSSSQSVTVPSTTTTAPSTTTTKRSTTTTVRTSVKAVPSARRRP